MESFSVRLLIAIWWVLSTTTIASALDVAQAAPSSDPSASETSEPPAAGAAPSCSPDVTLAKGLRYGVEDPNVLDVASPSTDIDRKRPVVVFFTGGIDRDPAAASIVPEAMCFAAQHGLVAFRVQFRDPTDPNSSKGEKDVADALSWVSENADLFVGNIHEIIPIGFGAGASHVLRLALHEGYQVHGDAIAGVVLISGVFGKGRAASDLKKVDLMEIDVPIILAWSTSDDADLKMRNEDLKKCMCDAGHCPRSVVLATPSNPGSGFDLDGASPDLHDRVRQLIAQLDARGLP